MPLLDRDALKLRSNTVLLYMLEGFYHVACSVPSSTFVYVETMKTTGIYNTRISIISDRALEVAQSATFACLGFENQYTRARS